MTGKKISTDASAADSLVIGFKSLTREATNNADISESNSKGLLRALEINNSIVEDINNFSFSIKDQADKFPKIAAIRENQDKLDKQIFGE